MPETLEPPVQKIPDAAAASAADKSARDAAVKQADAFFKGDIKEAPKGNPSDLFKKMAEKLNQDASQFNERIEEEKESKSVLETKAPVVDEEKKQGFIKSLKQTNEQLTKETADLKSKLTEYEQSKLEIEELRAKIDDSESKKQVDRLQKELASAIKEKQEREKSLSNELDQIRKANAFLNLPGDPVFKQTYDQPIANGFSQVRLLLNEDHGSLVEFDKAVNAYESSIRSNDQNEKMRQREISKQILNEIYENLQPMEQAKFNSTAYDVLSKVEARSQALQNWEITKAQADEENRRRSNHVQSQTTKRWQDAYSSAKAALDDAIKYPEDIAKIILDQKIDDDTSEDELIAAASLNANSNYAPEQITRVLQQGAKFKRQKAYTFALEKQVSELNETIRKMRGSSTGDSSIGSSSSGKASQIEERTPEALFARFRK